LKSPENIESILSDKSKLDAMPGMHFRFNIDKNRFEYLCEKSFKYFGIDRNTKLENIQLVDLINKTDLLKIILEVKKLPREENNFHCCYFRLIAPDNSWRNVFSEFVLTKNIESDSIINGMIHLLPHEIINSDIIAHTISVKNSSYKELKLYSTLTKREKELLIYICKGYQNKQISDFLNISISTVETHRKRIIKKLKVKSSMELHKYVLIED